MTSDVGYCILEGDETEEVSVCALVYSQSNAMNTRLSYHASFVFDAFRRLSRYLNLQDHVTVYDSQVSNRSNIPKESWTSNPEHQGIVDVRMSTEHAP